MAEYVMESYAKQELDSSVAALADGLAIVSNGNTHAAIAKGQFVYVRNHGTLAEGLYKAPAAIAANASLTSSNLTADSNGGLNALNEQMANIASRVGEVQASGTWSGNQSLETLRTNVTRTGISIAYMADSLITGWSIVITYVYGNFKYIIILSTGKLVYTYTTGTAWATGSVALSS